jgi:hypothetical protein
VIHALALVLLVSPAWSLVEKNDGIELYERELPGERVVELKLVTVSKRPLDKLCLAAYGDRVVEPNEPDVASRKMLWQDGGTRVCYETVQAPMVSNRDYAVVSTIEGTPAGGCRTHFEAANQYAPPLPGGYVRIDKMRGGWSFEPAPGGNVVCTYTVFCDPGGSIPAMLIEGPRKKSAVQWMKHVMERADYLAKVDGNNGVSIALPGRDGGRE